MIRSGSPTLDHAAIASIHDSAPFERLLKEFKGPYIELRFTFLCNNLPDVRGQSVRVRGKLKLRPRPGMSALPSLIRSGGLGAGRCGRRGGLGLLLRIGLLPLGPVRLQRRLLRLSRLPEQERFHQAGQGEGGG